MKPHALRTLRPLGNLCLAACLLGTPLLAAAHEYFLLGFTLIHPWADPTEPGVQSAPVYFKLDSVNAPDRLLKVVTPYAEAVELRGDGNAAAQALASIDIAPGSSLDFGADRPHLLLQGLKVPLQWGRSYQMTMMFEKAGPVQVMVSVGAH